MIRNGGWVAIALGAFLSVGCASTREPPTSTGPPPAAVTEPEENDPDPIQGFNRGSFATNEFLDRFLFKPLATGWAYVTPEYFRTHFAQIFQNLNFPGYFVNNLLQGDPKQSGVELVRFVLNTTVGVAGFWDPAGHMGLEGRHEDFGQTLGLWGLGPGAYIVLPYVTVPGSTGRDLSALPIDTVLNVGDSLLLPGAFFRGVNRRALLLDEIREAKEAAFDWYVFTRNAYLQQRRDLIRNGDAPSPEISEDLYEIDDEDYE